MKRQGNFNSNGEENVNAKLRNTDIPVIRERLAQGETQAAVAHDFGVTRKCIGHINTGFTWRHIA